MLYRILLFVAVLVSCCGLSYGQWLELSNVEVKLEPSKMGGPSMVVEYDMKDPRISPEAPAYIFIRYSKDLGETKNLKGQAKYAKQEAALKAYLEKSRRDGRTRPR